MLIGARERILVKRISFARHYEVNSREEALKVKPWHGCYEATSVPDVPQHLNIRIRLAKILPERYAFTVSKILSLPLKDHLDRVPRARISLVVICSRMKRTKYEACAGPRIMLGAISSQKAR